MKTNVDAHPALPGLSAFHIVDWATGNKRLTCPACRGDVCDADIEEDGPFYEEVKYDVGDTTRRKNYRLCPLCSKAKLYLDVETVKPVHQTVENAPYINFLLGKDRVVVQD